MYFYSHFEAGRSTCEVILSSLNCEQLHITLITVNTRYKQKGPLSISCPRNLTAKLALFVY